MEPLSLLLSLQGLKLWATFEHVFGNFMVRVLCYPLVLSPPSPPTNQKNKYGRNEIPNKTSLEIADVVEISRRLLLCPLLAPHALV